MSREPIRQATRRAPPKLPRHPEAEALKSALERLTGQPEWLILVEYLKAKEVEAMFGGQPKEPGALLRDEGRRSLIVELERLKDRLTDDDRSEQRE